MRFTLAACLAAFTAAASANTIEFVNQDSTTRTIYFTANAGLEAIPELILAGHENKTVSFPKSWIGNWFSVSKGLSIVPGMLGEIAWDGYSGNHFFDVSAIVNPLDHDGVKMMYPKTSKLPLSGCQIFPCSNAYNLPDDIQTLSTKESELVCLVGNTHPTKRAHPRHFVTGHHSQ